MPGRNERAHAYDVVIIGLGAMGSAACMELARRGRRVLGLERFAIPHAMGSSHGESRIIRLSYFEHPDYVPLLRRAFELWEDLGAAGRRQLLHLTGGVYMGRPDGQFISGTLRAVAEHDLPHERLSRDDLRRRYPQFTVPEDFIAVHEPNAGLVLPEMSIAAFAEQALHSGADLRAHERVLEWESAGGAARVRTDRGEYRAEQLIICGGAWSERLLGDVGAELTVTRQVLAWLWPRRPESFELGTLPVWAMDDPAAPIWYGFPMLPGRPGVKIAHHYPAEPADPEALDRQPGVADRVEIEQFAQQMMPEAAGTVLSLMVCMYTNTPDAHFVIDRHPAHENVLFACGFSGHGFKFASVIGEILAELACDSRTRHPIDFFSLGRFVQRESHRRDAEQGRCE